MRANRFWIEIIALGTAIALAVALLIATLGAAAATMGGQGENGQATVESASKTYYGMITCARCGAKHSASLAHNASDCVRICVHGGSNFALIDGDKLYKLEGDRAMIKKVAGQRAAIIGVAHGNTITVSSVAAAS